MNLLQSGPKEMPLGVNSLLLLGGVLLAWELLVRLLLSERYILAAPSAILERLASRPDLYARALLVTLREAAWGFLYGNGAAILLAIGVALVPVSEQLIQNLALVVFCLPLVATGPVLRVILGTSDGPQITLAALAVYYTTFVPVVVGLRAIPASWADLVASYGRGRLAMLRYVRARSAVPYLVAGLQVAAPAAVLGAMVGEFTGAERGLGVLVIQGIRSLDVVATWTVASLATVASIAVYFLVVAFGQWLSPGAPPLLLTARLSRKPSPGWISLGMVVLTGLVILLVWQIGMDWLNLNRFFAKRPGDVWEFLVTHANAGSHREQLVKALGSTLGVTVPGYFVGLMVGLLTACVFELFPLVRRGAMPLAIALRSVPIITTAPLVIIVLGRGAVSLITLVAVMTFFPTLIACAQGLRQVPGQVIDVFNTFAAQRLTILLLARLPAALPAFFAGARIAVPTAVLAATVAEWLATGTGIGNLMALTYSTSNYGLLWSAVVMLTVVSVAGYSLVVGLERLVLSQMAPEQVVR